MDNPDYQQHTNVAKNTQVGFHLILAVAVAGGSCFSNLTRNQYVLFGVGVQRTDWSNISGPPAALANLVAQSDSKTAWAFPPWHGVRYSLSLSMMVTFCHPLPIESECLFGTPSVWVCLCLGIGPPKMATRNPDAIFGGPIPKQRQTQTDGVPKRHSLSIGKGWQKVMSATVCLGLSLFRNRTPKNGIGVPCWFPFKATNKGAPTPKRQSSFEETKGSRLYFEGKGPGMKKNNRCKAQWVLSLLWLTRVL